MSTLNLQPDPTAGLDTELRSTAANNNYGVATQINVSSFRAGLIQFDLSSIPSSATITSATLSLNNAATGFTQNVAIQRMLKSWTEGIHNNVTATTGESTWTYQSYNGTSWSSAGAAGSGTDRASSNSDTGSKTGTSGTWETWSASGIVSDVQNWVNGSNPNYGWRIIGDGSSSIVFWTSDYTTDTTKRPKLAVTYTTASGPANIATINGLAESSVGTVNGLAIASVGSWNGLA
jgi:hypothetical protein